MMSSSMTAEESLHAPARDDAVFEAAWRAHREKVYRLCLRYGGGAAQWAEELTQEVFISLFAKLPALSQTEDLGGWLYRVAANAALSRLRSEQSFAARALAVFFEREGEVAPAADVVFELRETEARALASLRKLPARERVVMCMRLLDGKPQREIAQVLGLSEGYVSKLVARGAQALMREGWELGDG